MSTSAVASLERESQAPWGSPPPASEQTGIADRAARGDAEAVRSVVQSNLPFVACVAREYRGMGLPFEDLMEEGALGLLEALRRFDPSRGLKFMTYAVWWVRRCIVCALARNASLVRVPRYRTKQFKDARVAFNAIASRLGRAPRAEEVADQLGIGHEEAATRLQAYPVPVPLDRPLRDGDHTSEYYFADGKAVDPEEEMIRREELDALRSAVERLPARERSVMVGRYGLDGGKPRTLRQLGAEMGLTKERIRQIEMKTRRKLGEALAASA